VASSHCYSSVDESVTTGAGFLRVLTANGLGVLVTQIGDLGATTADLLAEYFRRLGSGLMSRAENSAQEALYQLVTSRLGATATGRWVIDSLAQRPSDQAVSADLARLVNGEANADANFAERMRSIVESLNDTSTRFGPSVASGPAISIGGRGTLNAQRGVIAGGSVDQSRRFHFNVGGLVALVLVAALVGAGTGAMVGYRLAPSSVATPRGATGEQTGTPAPAPSGQGDASGSCGSRPRCAAYRGYTFYLSDYAIIPPSATESNNGQTLRFSLHILNSTSNNVRFDESVSALDRTGAVINLAGPNQSADGCGAQVEFQVPPGGRYDTPTLCYDMASGSAEPKTIAIQDDSLAPTVGVDIAV